MLQELNAQCQQNTGVDSLTCLIWLTLSASAIGTEGFMIAGLLPALARDLNIGLPAAGHLVTAFCLAYEAGRFRGVRPRSRLVRLRTENWVPASESVLPLLIKYPGPYLQEQVRPARAPAHLPLLHHPLAHHLIDRRFHEPGGDFFPVG